MKKQSLQPDLFADQLTPDEIKAEQFAAIAFELFAPQIPKWHQLQDTGSAIGNCFFWWRSRYGEWLHDENFEFERRHKIDKSFPDVWVHYEKEMTRNNYFKGLPKNYY